MVNCIAFAWRATGVQHWRTASNCARDLQVLLVGGATRMPAVRRAVHNMTGLPLRPGNIDPDAAVAVGAPASLLLPPQLLHFCTPCAFKAASGSLKFEHSQKVLMQACPL